MPPHLQRRFQQLLIIGRRMPFILRLYQMAPPRLCRTRRTRPQLVPRRRRGRFTVSSSIVVAEPGASERIVAMALHFAGPAAPTIGGGDSAPGHQQPRPEQVTPSHRGSASAKGETEVGSRG